jgi:two-component system chemotaxis sensor kinase CheA
MLVKVGENVYIIPTQSIVRSFRPAPGSVFSDTDGREMIIIDGKCYSVIKLYEHFNVETKITDYSEGIIVVCEYDEKIICLFVDNLIGEQQVVVKSLPEYLTRFKLKSTGVGGCTILGDGSISLILDTSEIAENK